MVTCLPQKAGFIPNSDKVKYTAIMRRTSNCSYTLPCIAQLNDRYGGHGCQAAKPRCIAHSRFHTGGYTETANSADPLSDMSETTSPKGGSKHRKYGVH